MKASSRGMGPGTRVGAGLASSPVLRLGPLWNLRTGGEKGGGAFFGTTAGSGGKEGGTFVGTTFGSGGKGGGAFVGKTVGRLLGVFFSRPSSRCIIWKLPMALGSAAAFPFDPAAELE